VISTRSIYRIGWLGRLPLKTPYPAVAERIGSIMRDLPRGASLVVDFGGVGRGIMTCWSTPRPIKAVMTAV
jgi:hypothetical protein